MADPRRRVGRRVRLTGEAGDDRSATWSPDGRRLAFDSTRDGNTEIYVIDADGANPVRVTVAPGEDWAASWSPDGRTIAFTSDRSGSAQIWATTPDGAEPRQLTDDTSGNLWPTWSPDGSRIAITSWRTGGSQVWDIAADGSDPRPLGRSPRPPTPRGMARGRRRSARFHAHGGRSTEAQPIAREDLGRRRRC